MYAKYIKRPLDCFLSICAILVLSPIFLILIVLGAIEMKGNPFFTQQRPGKDEKIFKLIKFRTMTCKTDENGNLLPDEERLTKYGKILRSSSFARVIIGTKSEKPCSIRDFKHFYRIIKTYKCICSLIKVLDCQQNLSKFSQLMNTSTMIN